MAGIALALTLAASAAPPSGFPESSPPPRLVGLATPTEECAEHIFHGLQDILLGWDESAYCRFCAAVDADPGCALAHLGKLLTSSTTPSAAEIDTLRKLIRDDLAMTPAESALVSTGLILLAGDRNSAAREFRQRIVKWRADTLSACWAVLLLHDGYEESGNPRTGQKHAMELIQQLWLKHRCNHPCSAIVCYLRALVEETAPTVSEEALQSAQYAAQLLPHHPSPQLLYGHLLLRSGRVHDSIEHFRKAAELAAKLRVAQGSAPDEPPYVWPLEMRAHLYEATALWMDGQFDAALAARRRMNAWPLSQEQLMTQGGSLIRWEANTLPLRILVLRPELPTQSEINAAVKAATPNPPLENDAVLHVRDCLRFALVAKLRAKAGRDSEASRCIQAAEKSCALLREAEESARRAGALSSWLRACEACDIAINAAKAAAYDSTSEIWEQNLRRAARPTSLLMPPVIPQVCPNSSDKP